ncbi:MAG: Gfo/Idh/MocA family oxidoreductase [Myxococcota bacterium]|nr:Gfo/Idh/MocA family oxidoreductase [Myxococcota bacterium]
MRHTSIKFAIIGYGHLGGYHAAKVKEHPEAELVAIVDPDANQRAKARVDHDCIVYEHIDQIHDSLNLDAAIVASPTETHADTSTTLLGQGYHLLIEKPATATQAELSTLIALVEKKPRIVQVGHVERFNPAIQQALPLVSGARYITSERLGPFSGRSGNIDVIMDLMIHDLDLVAAIIPDQLIEVRAAGVPIVTAETDMASVRLAFGGGQVAELRAGRASMEQVRKIRFFSKHGYVSVDCKDREVKCVHRDSDSGGQWPAISAKTLDVPNKDPLYEQLNDFIVSIRTQSRPKVDLTQASRVLDMANQINTALKTSQLLEI